MDKMILYNHLPVPIQNLACSIEGYKIFKNRYTSYFWKCLETYEELAKRSYDERCSYRDHRLNEMVQYCYSYIPYYRKIFDEGGINPNAIKSPNDLSVRPLLTKEEVRQDPESFTPNGLASDLKVITQHSSGTTGAGFVFNTTYEALSDQWALWWRYRRGLGIPFSEPCAVFGGRPVIPPKKKTEPFYRINKPNSQYMFSQYHLNSSTISDYVKELRRIKVRWIHGYPSVLALLAKFMVEHDITLSMDWVTTGAENLLDSQKDIIEKAFGVRPYQHYGLSEAVANFSENIDGEMYVDEEFSAVEFLPQKESEHFSVVGTTLNNFAMPLLRYVVNDEVDFKETVKGRKIIAIDGRKEDYVVLSNGERVGRLDHLFKDSVNIREAQIQQKIPGEIDILLNVNSDFNSRDEDFIRLEISSRMSGIKANFIYVDKIPRTKSGKLRLVVSDIREGKLD